MANHYLLVGVAARDFERDQVTAVDTDFWEFEGTIYSEEIRQLNKVSGKTNVLQGRITQEFGDLSPMVIQMTVADKAPNPKDLAAITAKLSEIFFLEAIMWVGHDPRKGTLHRLEITDVDP